MKRFHAQWLRLQPLPGRSARVRTACLLLLLGAACTKGAGDSARPRPPPLVAVARVSVRDVEETVRAPVDLRPLLQADVGAKTLGYLDAVLVDRGDRVHKGQLLATVRPSDLPDQLAAARSAAAQSDAAVALARANLDRARALAPSGRISKQELQQAETALAAAEATRAGATRLQHLKLGQTAHLELDAMPGRRFDGRVVRLAPSLDPATRTLDAEVHLPNRDGLLRAGMYGRASIVTGVHPGAMTVPVGAVQISNGRNFVYVLRGDRVQRREVQLGVDGEDWLEIRSGLGPDDEVVSAGLEGLSDQAQVRPARGVELFGNPGELRGAQVKPPPSTVKD